jgi:hypothetical protein
MAVAVETRTDAQIQSDVLNELKWDARVQPNEIGVTRLIYIASARP